MCSVWRRATTHTQWISSVNSLSFILTLFFALIHLGCPLANCTKSNILCRCSSFFPFFSSSFFFIFFSIFSFSHFFSNFFIFIYFSLVFTFSNLSNRNFSKQFIQKDFFFWFFFKKTVFFSIFDYFWKKLKKQRYFQKIEFSRRKIFPKRKDVLNARFLCFFNFFLCTCTISYELNPLFFFEKKHFASNWSVFNLLTEVVCHVYTYACARLFRIQMLRTKTFNTCE